MSNQNETLLFEKENYLILIVGVAVVILGFLLMLGGGSDDPNVFSPEVFSFRRITLAPVVVILGFLVVGYSIFHTPKKSSTQE